MLRPGRKERPEDPPPHVTCYTTTASSRTCRGWGFPRLKRVLKTKGEREKKCKGGEER